MQDRLTVLAEETMDRMRSRLRAEIGPVPGSSIRVSGTARWMGDGE